MFNYLYISGRCSLYIDHCRNGLRPFPYFKSCVMPLLVSWKEIQAWQKMVLRINILTTIAVSCTYDRNRIKIKKVNVVLTLPFCITKTCLYNFDPLKPHFYIVKLGFTGVCIIFLISAKNIDCGYLLEPPHRGGSNEYAQSMF